MFHGKVDIAGTDKQVGAQRFFQRLDNRVVPVVGIAVTRAEIDKFKVGQLSRLQQGGQMLHLLGQPFLSRIQRVFNAVESHGVDALIFRIDLVDNGQNGNRKQNRGYPWSFNVNLQAPVIIKISIYVFSIQLEKPQIFDKIFFETGKGVQEGQFFIRKADTTEVIDFLVDFLDVLFLHSNV
jgi:hypothetical protein